MYDAEHSQDNGLYGLNQYSEVNGLNEQGQAVGDSSRFAADGRSLGSSLWFYNGSTTINIGLTDAEHTRSTDGYRWSGNDNGSIGRPLLNDAGQVASGSRRFNAAGDYWGYSAIFYNDTTTLNIGLVDAKHTSEVDGTRYSIARQLNEAGQVTGYSYRYGAGGVDLGQSA